MTDKPAPFAVQPEWRGSRLMVGKLQIGEVMRPMSMPQTSARALGIDNRNQDKWIGLYGATATGYHTTEAEAKAAVENAVREALGGKPCE